MNTKNFLYVANWKSYLHHAQGYEWLKNHAVALQNYSKNLIICPDFTLLTQMSALLPPSMCGAQDCSAYPTGAYTGEITAQTLASCGVHYCIVGHWERATNHGESSDTTAQKSIYLLQNSITPIVCVGNTHELTLRILKALKSHPSELIIAYEPHSAIGTGMTPAPELIEKVVAEIRSLCSEFDAMRKIRILYGGSVNSHNCGELKKISSLDGFLIGKASTDFQELKKIVEC